MRFYLDGFQPDANGEPQMVASLDETEKTAAERQADLTDARVVWPNATFYWHECKHDDGLPCIRTLV